MTQDEIIKMLRKSGAIVTPMGFVTEPPTLTVVDVMERFAKLVAQHEREACADIAENWRSNGMPRTGVANEIRARGQA
jgi:hypothetical protein